MALTTSTYLELKRKLNQSIGDDIRVAVTTAIAASASVVSTNLNQYDLAADGHFDSHWVYIEDKANAGVERFTGSSTYATSGGTLTVYGGNLTTDGANLATVRLQRFQPSIGANAILRAIEQLYPALHRKVDNQTLIAGNILPNAHFEDFTAATIPDKYTLSGTATVVADTTASKIRGGTTSAKLTAGVASDYFYITSDNYPRLLDLQGRTVDFKAWANPDTADDAQIVIYTKDKDGTTATKTSTTTSIAADHSLIEIEGYQIPDNLVEIQFRFQCVTNGNIVYFDDARVIGLNRKEYLLPLEFTNGGHVSQAQIQVSGVSEDIVDDLHPTHWEIPAHRIINDGTDTFLHLPFATQAPRRIRLIGYKPLETLSSDSDTLTLTTERVNLIIAYAAHILYEQAKGPVSSEDKDNLEKESRYWLNKATLLHTRLAMSKPAERLWIGEY